jgi:hypothetical protein
MSSEQTGPESPAPATAVRQPPVPIDRIATAPVEIPSGADLNVARKEAEFLHQREYFKRELGWLGIPFGGRSEKPGNISALVIVLCFAAMFAVYFWPGQLGSGISLKEAWQSIMSVVTLILGYLFGSNERSSKD